MGGSMSNIILTGDTSGTLNLAAPLVAGTNTQTLVAATDTLAPIVRGTYTAASGTAINFTDIPSWVKRITIMFNQVSTTGTSPYLIQLGTSGGVEATGYSGSAIALQGSAVSSAANTSSIGFFAAVALNVAADIYCGNVVLTNITGNTWIQSGVVGNVAASRITNSTGVKATAAVLDRIRITTVNGTDTFDLGAVNIMWE
jgi:hypothetical protein